MSWIGAQVPVVFDVVQHLPFCWLLVCIGARLLGLRSMTSDLPLVIWSFWISWAYLRFVQHNADGTVGDVSEDFALINLFPKVGRSSL